jgi:diamine N-acetyltransferase
MAKSDLSPIEKDNLRLRLLERVDLPMTLNWRNQEHIRKWFIHSDPISWEKHQNWFEKYREDENDYIFIIEEKSVFNKSIGQISLYNIDRSNNRGELGRLMIGEEEACGKGLAKKATRLLVEIAFNHFQLKELYLHVFKNNCPAIHIYEQCGFKKIKEAVNLVQMNLFKN